MHICRYMILANPAYTSVLLFKCVPCSGALDSLTSGFGQRVKYTKAVTAAVPLAPRPSLFVETTLVSGAADLLHDCKGQE